MSELQPEQTLWHTIRSAFGRGLVIMIPVVITAWVLTALLNAVDGVSSWVFELAFGRKIPGLGFITTVALIFIVGWLSPNFLAQAILNGLDKLISTIPVARTIYSSIKDLIKAFGMGEEKGSSFRQVVLVEYPRMGMFTVGFATNDLSVSDRSGTNAMTSVYIPNPPNPTSGVLVLVPAETVQTLDMTVEEGLKLVLSGGIVSSGTLSTK